MSSPKYMSEEFWVGARCYMVEVRQKRDNSDKYMIIKESGAEDDRQHPVIVFQDQMQHFMGVIERAFVAVLNDVRPIEGEILAQQVHERAAKRELTYQKRNSSPPPNVGAKWTLELDQELKHRFKNGENIKSLAAYFGRNLGGIRSRLKKLELIE